MMINPDAIVDMLNEAVALDPRLWALFDVMVPCAPVVGHVTPLELMGVHPKLAMANTLGVVNAIIANPYFRISIITENVDGQTKRVFARTSNAPRSDGNGIAELPSDTETGSGTQSE